MHGMRVVAVVIAMGVLGASCGGEEPTKCNKQNAAIGGGLSYFIEMTLIDDSVVRSGATPTLGECIEYSVEC